MTLYNIPVVDRGVDHVIGFCVVSYFEVIVMLSYFFARFHFVHVAI